MTDPLLRRILLAALLALAGALVGCRSTNHLAEYDFDRARLVALAPLAAPPDVYTDATWRAPRRQGENVIESAIRVGTTIAKEVGAAEARRKLVEAESEVDVAMRIADASADRAARMLGARLVNDERSADFALEIVVDKQGIFAVDSFSGRMLYGVEGRIRMVHLDSGRRVWERKIQEREVFASSFGGDVGAAISGVVLAGMTKEEMVDALKRLSDRMALSVVRRLGDDLERGR